VLTVPVDVDAEPVVGVEALADEVLEDAATTAESDVELEWLLEPHAATSSTGASAKPIRLRIGSGIAAAKDAIIQAMRIALVTTYPSDYRLPLYRLLAERDGLEVLCYGRGARYAPAWSASLDEQLAAADFPARRIDGPRAALELGREYDAVIAPFAGGSMLPAAYAGAERFGTPFVLWASVWHQPRSVTHALALPVTRHIYRHADAVIAYGEHVRRFAAQIRGRDDDIFVAPQAVERDLFGRHVDDAEIAAFRAEHELGDGPLVLYTGRLVAEKGIEVLAKAWPQLTAPATLILAGDGPYAEWMRSVPGARLLGPVARDRLVVAYAAAQFTVVPSIPTPRFKEPWGLVVNEAFEQGRTVIATTAVGAAAGGLVRGGETGIVIAPNDPERLATAIDGLLGDDQRREQLGSAARAAVQPFTYEAMAAGVQDALTMAAASSWRGR
jgi:glycosyltransferase involved in cell wall biosynthesis